MGLIFSATSLDECIKKAAKELGISRESIKYKIISEEKKFFRKKVEIEILEEKQNDETNIEVKEDIQSIKEEFGARVQDGKIIITDSEKSDEIITIRPCKGIELFVNEEQCNNVTPVKSTDIIDYKFEEVEAVRNVNIHITNDKMEAHLTIQSTPKYEYRLVDQENCRNLILKREVKNKKYLPKYSLSELKDLLVNKGIKYGIIEEELKDICDENEVDNVLVAKGQEVQNDIPDQINILFKQSDELVNYNDSEEKINYRNRFLIAKVNVGDIIGEIIPGKSGKDGINILGIAIKKLMAKKVVFKCGEGCRVENNKIIATTEGKPCFKANSFNVNKLYKVDDVDLKTGNINFIGNVEVVGSVCEGMEVVAGNELLVGKNVECAKVNSSGQVMINGNVINSTIATGCENVERKQYLDNLVNYKELITELISCAKQVKENNLLGERLDGEIIKVLMENKFKSLPNLSKKILNYNVSQDVHNSELAKYIISKLIGIGPLKIKSFEELQDFIEILEEEIQENEFLVVIPTDIYLNSSQSSTIEASGSVYITGKGQYNSQIIALNNIEFTNEKAVCRGGTLTAGSEIKLKTVGSVAGVITRLKVPKKGRITANIAYNNTIFCFGEKQVVLEVSGKNVEAYIDENDQITIDKFILEE